jgi:hypothetical protein
MLAQPGSASREAAAAAQYAAGQAAAHPTTPTTADTQHVAGAATSDLPSATSNPDNYKAPEGNGAGLKIGAEKDLPHIRYPLHGSASSLVSADSADFNSFLSHYAPDLNTLLAGFAIENRELLLRLLEAQEDAAILMGDRKAAEAALDRQRSLEAAPAARALVGLSDYSLLHAWKKAGTNTGDSFQKAYADDYAHRVNALPWASLGDQMKAMADQCGAPQPSPAMEYVKLHLDPEAAGLHAVTLGHADRIVLARKAMQFDQATQTPRCTVLTAYVASHSAPLQASASERK